MVRTSKRGQALSNIWSSSHGLNLALCEHTATLWNWKSESATQSLRLLWSYKRAVNRERRFVTTPAQRLVTSPGVAIWRFHINVLKTPINDRAARSQQFNLTNVSGMRSRCQTATSLKEFTRGRHLSKKSAGEKTEGCMRGRAKIVFAYRMT